MDIVIKFWVNQTFSYMNSKDQMNTHSFQRTQHLVHYDKTYVDFPVWVVFFNSLILRWSAKNVPEIITHVHISLFTIGAEIQTLVMYEFNGGIYTHSQETG